MSKQCIVYLTDLSFLESHIISVQISSHKLRSFGLCFEVISSHRSIEKQKRQRHVNQGINHKFKRNWV
jgi:hypothetical protein